MKFKKIAMSCIIPVALMCFLSPPTWGFPNLQIYIPGATYDAVTETWVINSYDYELWVIGAHYDILDVKMALAFPEDEHDGHIDITWLESGSFNGEEYGYDSLLTLTEEGGLPYEEYRADYYENPDASAYAFDYGTPMDGDGNSVPPGETFPTNFYEYFIGDLLLSSDEVVRNYIPGEEEGETAAGDILKFDISVSGYSWVDIIAYDHIELSNNTKYVFSPYSHDASAVVPEPATLLLVGAGLLGLAGFRRKIKR